MKKNIALLIASLGLASEVTASGQGAFQNLDFESATVRVTPPGEFGSLLPISTALPGWSGFLGTNQQTHVLHNNITLGDANISILGPHWGGGILEGNFSVLLQEGNDPRSPASVNHVPAAIAQTGLIPDTAASLRFRANFSGVLLVTVGGQDLTLVPLATGPNYIRYGADISAYVGQELELRFIAPTLPGRPNDIYFDAIIFSNLPIPEPGTLVSFALGTVLLGWWFRRGVRS